MQRMNVNLGGDMLSNHLNTFQINEIEKLLPKPVAVAKVNKALSISLASEVNPRPIDRVEYTVFGEFNNNLYVSNDNAVTWDLLYEFDGSYGAPIRVIQSHDNELFILFSKGLFKTLNWTSVRRSVINKITLGFEQTFIAWSIAVKGIGVIVADYAVPHTASKGMWISKNYGETFVFRSKNDTFPNDDANTHHHGVEYDDEIDRFWVSMGDGDWKSQYYSDDDGVTWQPVALGSSIRGGVPVVQCTTMTIIPDGIILGSDTNVNSGLLKIYDHRTSSPYIERIWSWRSVNTSTNGFALKNEKVNGGQLVFTCFRSDFANIVPVITWSNGYTGGVFYEYENSWSANDGFRNVVVLENGEVLTWFSRSGVGDEVLKFKPYTLVDTRNIEIDDKGNILGGSTSFISSLSVGPLSEASSSSSSSIGYNSKSTTNSVAIGTNAEANGIHSVVIGMNASCADIENVVIGQGNSTSHRRNVIIGDGTTGSGNECILIGHDVSNTGAIHTVSIGSFSIANGNNAVVIGRLAQVNGHQTVSIGYDAESDTNCIAVGYSALANNINSVAIGHSVQTELDNSFAIGEKDLHIQSNAVRGIVLQSPDGTKYRVTVANGGTLSVSAI